MGDDVDVDGGDVAEEAVDDVEVEEIADAGGGGAAEDDLGDAFFFGEGGHGGGDVFTLEADYFCAEVFGEADVGVE